MSARILALSGGGYLGLYTATVLDGLEEWAGDPLARRFHLLAGTSAGAIIALGLAAGLSASRIRALFLEAGRRIFHSGPEPGAPAGALRHLARSLLRPEYDGRRLRQALTRAYGEHLCLGDLERAVVVPAIGLGDSQPRFFRGGELPGAETDTHVPVVDAALAASAVPPVFPPVQIDGESFVDGGLFAASPDLVALEEARLTLGADPDSLRLLSVGTASARFEVDRDRKRGAGVLRWFGRERFMRLLVASQQAWTDRLMAARLGDRYLRIDREQSLEQQALLGFHVAPKRAWEILQEMGEASVREVLDDERLRSVLGSGEPAGSGPG